jgi:hypothetical protein
MSDTQSQPATTAQEAVNTPVANKLGLLSEVGLSDLLKAGNFLDEKEVVPTLEEQDTESEADIEAALDAADVPVEEEVHQSEESEDDSDNSSLTKGVQKRINKLVAAKKAAQAELDAKSAKLAELENELQSVKANTPIRQPEASDYVEGLTTLEQVQSEYQKAVEILMWCEDNVDGAVVPLPDGTEREFTSRDVREMRKTAMKRKEIELPARNQFLQNQASIEAEVMKDFPWYNKPESEEYRIAQDALRQFPEIKRRRADAKHIAGIFALGVKAYNEMKNKPNKLAPTQPIKRAPIQPGVKAPASPSASGNVVQAKKNFVKLNSDKGALSDLLKSSGFV